MWSRQLAKAQSLRSCSAAGPARRLRGRGWELSLPRYPAPRCVSERCATCMWLLVPGAQADETLGVRQSCMPHQCTTQTDAERNTALWLLAQQPGHVSQAARRAGPA